MNKRGQFYLIAAIILVGIVLGFASLSNSIKKPDIDDFNFASEELQIESQNVLEYTSYNGLSEEEILGKLNEFAENYSLYSNVESLYFIFGTSSTTIISAYNRKTNEKILVNGQEMNIPEGIYTSETFSSVDPITLNIGGVEHLISLNEGENFYYLINSKTNENEYVFVGNI